MPDDVINQWDPDIASLDLSDIEKNGLQIYRNYRIAFEKERITQFINDINKEPRDFSEFIRVEELLVSEDARSLPLIACAYADELIKSALKQVIPDGVPGGKNELFEGFGPLATLSARIKLAYAFELFSPDIMSALDKIRALRNALAHSWDTDRVNQAWSTKRLSFLYPVDRDLAERVVRYNAVDSADLSFRIQLIWLIGRVNYESLAFWRAKERRLPVSRALYNENIKTNWLVEISKICLNASDQVLRSPLATFEPGR